MTGDLSSWPHVYRPGEDGAPTFLMLHGTGSSEQEILGLAEAMDPTAAVLSPRGRISENGMRRWFRRIEEGVFDVDSVRSEAAELAAFVEWARSAYGLDARPITAIGFSNGANMALALAILHPASVSTVVAFSGMYPFADESLSVRLDALDVVLLNGDADPMAPSASVDVLEREAVAAGASVTRLTRSGSHGIAPSEIAAAQDWLKARADG